jgi:hypothetical protein
MYGVSQANRCIGATEYFELPKPLLIEAATTPPEVNHGSEKSNVGRVRFSCKLLIWKRLVSSAVSY